MKRKTRSAIPYLLAISFALFARLVLSARPAIAQDQEKPCQCWIDVKTGKKIPIIPAALGPGSYHDSDFQISGDGRSAFNTRTGQNYALEPDGCWIDVKTGKKIPIIPAALGPGSYHDSDFQISGDGKSAFNTRTGQNYALEPCPPPAKKKVIEKKKEACDLKFGYDYMRAPDESAKNLNGFGGSLFCNVKPWIAIGGDFGALFGSRTISGITALGPGTVDVSLHRQTYLFGPQFNFYPNDKVKVFVHPLFGGVHDTSTTTVITTSTTGSASAFAMAFGGGVDVNLNHRFAIRPIQFDYVPTHFGGAWQSNYQISTGVVIHLGEKK
jgi:hypothetical protein